MDSYLKNITEGTNINPTSTSVDKTSSEKLIINAKYNNEITQSDKDMISGVEDSTKPIEDVYAGKAVKVRKYKLYKKREI